MFCCNAAKEQAANKFNELLRTSLSMLCGSYNRMYSFKILLSCAFISRTAGAGKVSRPRADWKGRIHGRGKKLFLFQKTGSGNRPAFHLVGPGSLSQGIKRSGRQPDNLTLFIAEVQNAWSYTSAPPLCLHNVDTDNFAFFTFTCYSRGNVWAR